MTRAPAAVLTPPRRVTVKIDFGAADIEKAAESMELHVSDEEVEGILTSIDNELANLATIATRSAVLSRVFDELLIVCHAHSIGDDD